MPKEKNTEQAPEPNGEIAALRDEIAGMVEEAKAYRDEVAEQLSEELTAKVEEQLKNVSADGRPDPQVAIDILEVKKTLEDHISQVEDEKARARENGPGRIVDGSPLSERILSDEGVKAHLNRGYVKAKHVFNFATGPFLDRCRYNAAIIDSTGIGSSTPGILTPERTGYVTPARRRLTIREVLPNRTTTSNAVEFLQRDSFTNSAAMQFAEGSPKAESTLALKITTANVRTLAHWIAATSQVLDDLPELRRIIDDEMMHGMLLKEEEQLLSGDGTGQNLNGLITQATAFSVGAINANDTKIDFLRHAIAQIEAADEEQADFMVVNPADFWEMVGLKDQAANEGAYLSGSPFAFTNVFRLYGTLLVRTNSIAANSFLVGNSRAAAIFDRQQANVMISTEHDDFFVKNLVAIRFEERLALAVFRPGAFVKGSYATASP